MNANKSLSDLQIAIMRILWRRGEASVNDVHTGLQKRNRELAPTTVATMLSRLEKRNLIDHRLEGRQFIYFPLISETDVRRSMVKDLIGRLFQGDAKALVNHLVKESEVDPEDLEAIKEMIAATERGEKDRR